MMTVYKYNLGEDISLPMGATPLHVALQNGVATMWVLVDPDAPVEELRSFFIAGTGHDMPASSVGRYINTFFDGPFVFHVFEKE